jgi:NAD(P)-dependent dehydrogenase (short-subunit alcohol dehydrogenase family)
VNCVRSNGLPETSSIGETYAAQVRILGTPPTMGESALRRPVTIAEVAGMVAFLASDDASGVTGQVLTVCGGQFVG